MFAVAQAVFTMSMLARLFEAQCVLAMLNDTEPTIAELPEAIRELIMDEHNDEVSDLWFATRRRVSNAAKYEVEHIDDWNFKATLVGFDL